MRIRSAKDLGALIRDRRRRNGWDQQTLADHIGASRLWVGEMENGKSTAQIGLALRALAVLDIALHIGDEGNAAPPESRSAALIRKLLDER